MWEQKKNSFDNMIDRNTSRMGGFWHWFVLYYLMTICCLKESGLPLSDSDNDGEDDTYLEIPKTSEVLSAIMCVGIISVQKVVVKKLWIQRFQNEVYARNVKQTKLSHRNRKVLGTKK